MRSHLTHITTKSDPQLLSDHAKITCNGNGTNNTTSTTTTNGTKNGNAHPPGGNGAASAEHNSSRKVSLASTGMANKTNTPHHQHSQHQHHLNYAPKNTALPHCKQPLLLGRCGLSSLVVDSSHAFAAAGDVDDSSSSNAVMAPLVLLEHRRRQTRRYDYCLL